MKQKKKYFCVLRILCMLADRLLFYSLNIVHHLRMSAEGWLLKKKKKQ